MALPFRDWQPTQRALFDPRLPLPQWHELSAPTQTEVIALLAHLLLRVQTSAAPLRGDHNE